MNRLRNGPRCRFRMRPFAACFCTAAVVLTLLFPPQVVNGDDADSGDDADLIAEQLFVRRIAPLLREKCSGCHGADPDTIEGSLDVTSPRGLARGGDSEEPAVEPGQPNSSPLYLAVTREDDVWSAMPPKEAEKLSKQQIGWIHDWIAAGAAWPDKQRQQEISKSNAAKWSAEDGITVSTSGGLSADWTNRKYQPDGLWAYQPVKKPALAHPDDKTAHPIDQLIQRKMPADVTPAPRADRRTLIRRATFDLLGLPPKPKEIDAFVSDARSDQVAFAALIERLLASPHYGERMAQHWLDVVRYADSSGFANDFVRGNAWRYRDYVVRSFNQDKPYDRFIREQVAGDEIDPQDPEMIVATGFLRMGPWELTGMEVAKVARQRFLDDVTNSVGETFLAHSLQCARCHDHKFDPVPTRDYYSIQAVFATTQLAERQADFLPVENRAGFDEQRYLKQMADDYQQTLHELDEVLLANAEKWFAERDLSIEAWAAAVEQSRGGNSRTTFSRRGRGVFNAARSLMMKQGVPESEFPPKLVGFTPEQFGLERVARKGLERLRWELDRYQPYALSVYNGRTPNVKSVTAPVRVPADRMRNGELEETCILTGGSPFAAAAPVTPGVLSVLTPSPPEIPTTIEGRRTAFADWLASEHNPLTTRTIVNRIWLWHFNQPIAGNPNNFGSTGKRPTHPELLDWLAATFVESGWSFKSLHRRIMSSEAYCRASRHPQPDLLAERDPLSVSYAVFQPRRLTAEELRDAMLAATGELNPRLGGIPNRPEINREAALQPRQVMGTFAAAWTPNPLPEQRHRRSLYALKLRGLADPMLEVFNAPAPDFSCERRESSTVTPQVFSLFNSKNTHARALALAHRVIRETGNPDDQTGRTNSETDSDTAAINRCFELVYGRPATADEIELCRQHWHAILKILPETAVAQDPVPLEVVREAVEENTGEKFTFREKLHSNADFVPDLQPHQVDRRTRALADVCLSLLNSNEFIYVY